MNERLLLSIDRSLKILIALNLKQEPRHQLTMRQQISVLNDLGLKPIDISQILGRTATYVSKEISFIRKPKKGPKVHAKKTTE